MLCCIFVLGPVSIIIATMTVVPKTAQCVNVYKFVLFKATSSTGIQTQASKCKLNGAYHWN